MSERQSDRVVLEDSRLSRSDLPVISQQLTRETPNTYNGAP